MGDILAVIVGLTIVTIQNIPRVPDIDVNVEVPYPMIGVISVFATFIAIGMTINLNLKEQYLKNDRKEARAAVDEILDYRDRVRNHSRGV